jgi:hypothetical protein
MRLPPAKDVGTQAKDSFRHEPEAKDGAPQRNALSQTLTPSLSGTNSMNSMQAMAMDEDRGVLFHASLSNDTQSGVITSILTREGRTSATSDQLRRFWVPDPRNTRLTVKAISKYGSTLFAALANDATWFIRAYNIATGSPRWETLQDGSRISTWTPTAGPLALVACGAGVVVSTALGIYGLSRRTGRVMWERTDFGDETQGVGVLECVAGGSGVRHGVLCGGGSRKPYVLDAATGITRWKADNCNARIACVRNGAKAKCRVACSGRISQLREDQVGLVCEKKRVGWWSMVTETTLCDLFSYRL